MIEILRYPAIIEDSPIFPEEYTIDGLNEIRQKQGDFIFSTQYLLNPVSPEECLFKREWLHHYDEIPDNLVKYIFVDPANSQKKKSDFTAMAVIGIGLFQNFYDRLYLLDMVLDKLDVKQRVETFFKLVDKWRPYTACWEQAGMNSDHVLIEEMKKECDHKFNFKVIRVGKTTKFDRIRSLQPKFQAGQFLIPYKINYYSQYKKRVVNLLDSFMNEYITFSRHTCLMSSRHDDFLDALSQLCHEEVFIRRPDQEDTPAQNIHGTWAERKMQLQRMKSLRNLRANQNIPNWKIWQHVLAGR